MPIFRVTGIDSRSGETRSVLIEAVRMLHALAEAGRRGLHSVSGEELPETASVGDEVVIRANARSAGPVTLDAGILDSPLFTRPVTTIAKGVFLGLLLWALFVIVVYAVVITLVLLFAVAMAP